VKPWADKCVDAVKQKDENAFDAAWERAMMSFITSG
jgi:hypothetical protein